ncbi:soluble NSF attachment protein [Hyaloraphidium curvatum]|nr:soluble NSF attachment protein [Hyaloraphidium curvatum]
MGADEGEQLLAQAKKAASYTGWFGGNKLDEAAELYQKAANRFQLAKKWKEAGDAFVAAAEAQIKLQERDEAASIFVNASKAYKKVSPLGESRPDAVKALQQAVDIYTDRGRFHPAATQQKAIAEIYETDLTDLENAMIAYQKAADWYSSEDSKALTNNCLLKVAHFAAQLERYPEAIEKFESVAEASVDNNLTKWSVREYLMKAGLCHLASGDMVAAHRALEKYLSMDVTFGSTREYQFLKSLLEALEAGDVDAFTNVVVDFDRMTKLDPWKTSILLKMKKSIGEEMSIT